MKSIHSIILSICFLDKIFKKNQRLTSTLTSFIMGALLATLIEFVDVSGQIEVPQNTVASIGEKITLRCLTGSGERLQWTAKGGNNEGIDIFDGYDLNPIVTGYQINRSSMGQFDLIFNATRQTSMLYICIKPGSNPVYYKAEVIVVPESDPKCNKIAEHEDSSSDNVTLICEVNFYGNWPPTIEWRVDNETVEFLDQSDRSKGLVKGVLSIASDYFYTEKHTYVCHSSFSLNMYRGEETPKNVPSYYKTCGVHPDIVKNPSPDPYCKDCVTGAVVGSVVCVCALGGGTVGVLMWRKRRESEKQRLRERQNLDKPFASCGSGGNSTEPRNV